MKILNLFAGIGGNRYAWEGDHEVTAVEWQGDVASIYKERFPGDIVKITSAWFYVEEHFHEFEFIWASPPCPSHSKMSRTHVGRRYKGWDMKVQIPDMRLYGLILFLQHHFRGDWVVENVQPFYDPLIAPTAEVGRHLIWSNKPIPSQKFKTPPIMFKIDQESREYYRNLCDCLDIEWELVSDYVSDDGWNYGNDGIGQILRNTIHPIIAHWIWKHVTKPAKTLDTWVGVNV